MKYGIPVETGSDGTILHSLSIVPGISGFLCMRLSLNPKSTEPHTDHLKRAQSCQVCFSAGSQLISLPPAHLVHHGQPHLLIHYTTLDRNQIYLIPWCPTTFYNGFQSFVQKCMVCLKRKVITEAEKGEIQQEKGKAKNEWAHVTHLTPPGQGLVVDTYTLWLISPPKSDQQYSWCLMTVET